jgi:tetratricopeptide (TPR) repeat protein
MKKRLVMHATGRTTLLLIFALFLALGLWCGRSVAEQSLTPGIEYAAQGKFKEAKEEFERILQVYPNEESARQGLKIIERVTAKDLEEESAIRLFKGISYEIKGLWDEAIAEFDRSIQLNPTLVEAYFYRGLAYTEGKAQYDKAVSDFSKVIEITPEDTDVYNNRGVAYYLQGDYDKAWKDVKKVESLGDQVHPDFLKALREASGRQD